LALYAASHAAIAATALTTVGLGAAATTFSPLVPLIGIAMVVAVCIAAAIATRCIYKHTKIEKEKNDIEMKPVTQNSNEKLKSTFNQLSAPLRTDTILNIKNDEPDKNNGGHNVSRFSPPRDKIFSKKRNSLIFP
jgi:hypothetical protein